MGTKVTSAKLPPLPPPTHNPPIAAAVVAED